MHEVSSLRLLRVSENVRFKHDIIPWVIDERSDACVLANSPFLMSTLRGFTENCAERRCVSILLRFNPEASSDSCWVQQGGLSPVSIASPHFKCWKYLFFHFSWKVCHWVRRVNMYQLCETIRHHDLIDFFPCAKNKQLGFHHSALSLALSSWAPGVMKNTMLNHELPEVIKMRYSQVWSTNRWWKHCLDKPTGKVCFPQQRGS